MTRQETKTPAADAGPAGTVPVLATDLWDLVVAAEENVVARYLRSRRLNEDEWRQIVRVGAIIRKPPHPTLAALAAERGWVAIGKPD